LLADGSPDYNNLGVSKGTVYLWNISTRESISVPDPDNGPVWAMAYAPDGKTIATSDADSAIWLMSTETCKYTSLTSSGSGAPGPLTYAPDGKTLAAGDTASTTIDLWNTTTREPVKLSGPPSGSGIYFDDKVTSVAYAPDGKMIAAAYNDGAIWLWNTDTRKYTPLPVPNSHWFDTLAYAPDGGTLAAGSFQGATYMWDTATRKVMHLLRGPSDIYSVNSVAYMPGGRILAIGYSNGVIWLWDTVSGKIDAKLDPPSGSEGLTSITFNPTGTILAVGDRSGSIYLWRISYEASGTQPAASGSATIRPSSAQP
jgi:WD40 repeat protein